jgi:serine/threonine protein kinase
MTLMEPRRLTDDDDGAEAALPALPRHRILARLGEGAHGVVYVAETMETPSIRCAVKVLRAELDSTSALRRFEAERVALAGLDHPAIITINDAGRTADGRPFFAMPIVQGEPLTSASRQAQLSVRERVTLFLQVLGGVAHAHRRGMLHRDLKPGNVLAERVEGGWRVRIIDWGLAQALENEHAATARESPLTRTNGGSPRTGLRWEADAQLHAAAHAEFASASNSGSLSGSSTEFPLSPHEQPRGGVIGTPEFMSPEQADGSFARGDVRSDIWSLGVILYLLLTERLPFSRDEVRGLRPSSLSRFLRETPIDPPSRVALAASDALLFRGDLDAIIAKALARDPDSRYQSVDAFGADLEAWLRGEAVRARPESILASSWRFAARHRVASLAVVLAAIALCSSTVVALLAAQSAHRSEIHAETTAEFLEALLRGLESKAGQGFDRALMIEMLEDAGARLPELDANDPVAAARVRLALGNAWFSLGFQRDAERIMRPAVERVRVSIDEDAPLARRILAEYARVVLSNDPHRAREIALRLVQRGTPLRGQLWPRDEESLRALVILLPTMNLSAFEDASRKMHGENAGDSRPNPALRTRVTRLSEIKSLEEAVVLDPHDALAHIERCAGSTSKLALEARAVLLRTRVDYPQKEATLAELRTLHEQLITLPEHATVRGKVAVSISLALSQLQRVEELIAFAESERAALEPTLGPANGSILNLRFNRAMSLANLGRVDEVSEEFVEILAAYQRLQEPDGLMSSWVRRSALAWLTGKGEVERLDRMRATYLEECALVGAEPVSSQEFDDAIARAVSNRATDE